MEKIIETNNSRFPSFSNITSLKAISFKKTNEEDEIWDENWYEDEDEDIEEDEDEEYEEIEDYIDENLHNSENFGSPHLKCCVNYNNNKPCPICLAGAYLSNIVAD